MHFLVQVSTSLLRKRKEKRSQLFLVVRRSACAVVAGARVRDLLVEHVGDHLDLGFRCCDLLGGRGLGATLAEEEGHCWYVWGVSGFFERDRECV